VSRVIGIAVASERLTAVAVGGGRVVWAAETSYREAADLAAALAALAAERPAGYRATRVALGAAVARLKQVDGLPTLRSGELVAHVRLQSRRYFLQNGDALVTDAAALNERGSALLAAAPEALVEAVGGGLQAAGLVLREMAPAALYGARGSGRGGPRADSGRSHDPSYDDAYAAATGSRPRLALLPSSMRRERERRTTRDLVRWAALCAASLVLAGVAYVGGLGRQGGDAESQLATLRPALGAALAVRRDLDAATSSLETLRAADARRLHFARLLAEVTSALPDSSFLRALRVERDGRGSLVGYAPDAAAVLVALERVRRVSSPEVEGAVVREVIGTREWERFTISFRAAGSSEVAR